MLLDQNCPDEEQAGGDDECELPLGAMLVVMFMAVACASVVMSTAALVVMVMMFV